MRLGTSASIALVHQPWVDHAKRMPRREAIVHWHLTRAPQIWTWDLLVAAAETVANRLRAEGVKRQEICATILRHDFRFYPIYMGIVLAGAVPAVLAYPNARLHPDKFRLSLEGMLHKSGFDWVLTETELNEALAPLARHAGTLFRGTMFPYDWPASTANVPLDGTDRTSAQDEPCLLQHSSGTTGLQKPVMLSHRAVLDHLARYAAAIDLDEQDRVLSWLPLYHDMGLIAAFHLPLRFGVPLIQLDPFEWVKWPSMMLKALSETGATLAWLPNFAYNLMAQRADDADLQGVRLDSVRMLINCSEPVRAASHDLFFARCKALGLKESALSASYAMAEATFAVTQTSPGRRARELAADRTSLLAGRFAPAVAEEPTRLCVSSGRAIADCALRIVNSEGHGLGKDQVGEVEVRSISLFSGYRNHPEQTDRVLRDGWYRTGDLAFVHDDEVYVIGRLKDVIIVAGKNIYPEDIEDSISSLPDVLSGRVVAFGVEKEETGTEEIHVIVETPLSDEAAQRRLRQAVLKVGMAMDVTISRVILVPPRWLFKSSSGKPSRTANKERLLDSDSVPSAWNDFRSGELRETQ
jgi:fatty-acyl-CoA synthase